MKRAGSILVTAVLLSFLFVLAGCRKAVDEGEEKTIWFSQVTDPHLFYASSPEYKNKDEDKKKDEDKVRLFQEKLDQKAFTDLLAAQGSLPGGVKPDFLVVTGDFGVDRFWTEATAGGGTTAGAGTAQPASTPALQTTPASPPESTPPPGQNPTPTPSTAPSANRASAVTWLVEALKASPVKQIYFVPGNNDVGEEAADGPAVTASQAFFEDVRKGLLGSGVTLNDLTSCYAGAGGCYADAGETFRLVGFPSQSFKNENGADATKSQLQEAQVNRLADLVRQAEAEGKRVLVVTHIPELDDPFALAKRELQGEEPTGRVADQPAWAAVSPWNVNKKTLDKWKEIGDSKAVAGVLAGHFHDSHREIYEPPYRWAKAVAERADPGKLFLAPPLSVRYQDESPIQARGFALFRLRGDEMKRRLLWYEPAGNRFVPEAEPEPPGRGGRLAVWAPLSWLWDLAEHPRLLARAAVFAIALLVAFLAVVDLWQIPPPNTRPVNSGASQNQGQGQNPGPAQTTVVTSSQQPQAGGRTQTTTQTTETASSGLLAFKSNLARTAVAGLGGLALVTALNDFWQSQSLQEKPYYLVLFVVFFLSILALSAMLSGFNEALRSRISISRRLPHREESWYLLRRIWSWFLSLRVAGLVFLDTAFNVLQGRNQLKTAAYENELAHLHESIVAAVDRIRKELDDAFLKAIQHDHERARDSDVRVNISLLSEDESELFYISREEGSLASSFGPQSIAWLSASTGRPLWWTENYEPERIVLDDHKLKDVFQTRPSADYAAFVLLPVPWGHRSATEGFRSALIHISFKDIAYMKALWPGLAEAESSDPDAWKGLLETEPAKAQAGDGKEIYLKAVHRELSKELKSAEPLLTDLLRHFNDFIFEDYVRPRHKPQ